MAEAAPVGRPSDYGPAVATEVCRRLANGQSLREIARDSDMPSMTTVFNWIGVHPEFLEQYTRAKAAMAEHFAEDLLDIADDGNNDWMERKGEDGQSLGWRENGEALQRSKLRVDTRKWLLSKLLPKKYGERIQHANDPDNPLPAPQSDNRELAKAIVAALGTAVPKAVE